ncbi:MAG: hypothetical protein NC483_00925 [Ruminococcus sp.]|nr:hypothetical protein [Ruminococcus sp.]
MWKKRIYIIIGVMVAILFIAAFGYLGIYVYNYYNKEVSNDVIDTKLNDDKVLDNNDDDTVKDNRNDEIKKDKSVATDKNNLSNKDNSSKTNSTSNKNQNSNSSDIKNSENKTDNNTQNKNEVSNDTSNEKEEHKNVIIYEKDKPKKEVPSEVDNKTLVCIIEANEEGVTAKQTYSFVFKYNKFSNARLEQVMQLDSSLKEYLDIYKETFEEYIKNDEDTKGLSFEITDNGVDTINVSMYLNEEDLSRITGDDASTATYEDLKESLEEEGYICR